MEVTLIENSHLKVGVATAYGARVVSLYDKRAGREWMTTGDESPNVGENARYWGEEAAGWDECFPTVSRWDAAATPWRRNLRDHGDLWGRPWKVDHASPDSLSTTYADQQFRFNRTLRLDGPSLIAEYVAENLTDEFLPYLWALHALLAVQEGDRMELGALKFVSTVFMMSRGKLLEAGAVSWTERSNDLPFPLAEVQPRSAEFMAKLYSTHGAGGSARIGKPGAHLELGWDASIAHLGIWITYGAWPEAGGHYEVALEPTNAPSDHLGQTIAGGYPPLPPRGRHQWRVTLTVTD